MCRFCFLSRPWLTDCAWAEHMHGQCRHVFFVRDQKLSKMPLDLCPAKHTHFKQWWTVPRSYSKCQISDKDVKKCPKHIQYCPRTAEYCLTLFLFNLSYFFHSEFLSNQKWKKNVSKCILVFSKLICSEKSNFHSKSLSLLKKKYYFLTTNK